MPSRQSRRSFAGDGDAIGQRVFLRRDLLCIESNRLKAKASARLTIHREPRSALDTCCTINVPFAA